MKETKDLDYYSSCSCIYNLNLKIQIGRLDARKSHCVIRQEVRIACPYRQIGALF